MTIRCLITFALLGVSGKWKIFRISSENIFVTHLKIYIGVGRSPSRSFWAAPVRGATRQPAQAVPEGRPELLELDGVDEGVDGGVGVAQPEHKARPGVRERNLYFVSIYLVTFR